VGVGRIHFDQEDLDAVAEMDEDEEDVFCFGSDVALSWPGSDNDRNDSNLKISLGCRPNSNVLEVASVEPIKNAASMQIDVHIVHPKSLKQWTAENVKVAVNGYCPPFAVSGLDVTDADTRNCLASPDGLLCILVVRAGVDTGAPLPVSPQAQEVQGSTQSFLNALALTAPQKVPGRF
jgi:hypothetical protein